MLPGHCRVTPFIRYSNIRILNDNLVLAFDAYCYNVMISGEEQLKSR
ncbi:hypothetical protein Y11_12041 [Yersinia enterocolitica subsp. palearctica Y11]|uniref:Uncharacterized protein n=2 Tax=Yersinia enterocolitica TaxID=630 RepID=A0A0H3NPF8_YERE1|nr:unknown protein [Yersinia enterocolitica W22703]CBY26977.1 hypothetical protein Y11_12041 [Yersinia enterocolitica subsp. palearctica Y11]CCO68418.1 hypothetical protein D322_1544 [Yersinia enterocolitica IP 10393]